jgi:WD40 repeat protein
MAATRVKFLIASVAIVGVVSATGSAAVWKLWSRSSAAPTPLHVTATISRTLVHPGTTVSRAALSSDGRVIMTGGGSIFNGNAPADSDLRLWDVQSGAQLGRMQGHQGRIFDLVFRPGGTQAVSAADDGTARLWDLKTGQQIRQFDARLPITSMDVSPDGRWLLTGARVLSATQYGSIADRAAPRLRLWDIESDEMAQAFPAILQGVAKVAFSPDGQKIAAGLDPNPASVVLCRPDGRRLRTLSVGNTTITSLAFSPDGARVAAGCKDGTVYVWNAATGARLGKWRLENMQLLAMAFSPDGRTLVTAGGVSQVQSPVNAMGSDYAIHIFDAASGREIGQLGGHASSVFTLRFSADGSRLLSAGGQSVFLWDVRNNRD